jgi:hypothetical protein
MRNHRDPRRGERGVAVVEFAMLTPLLLLLCGITASLAEMALTRYMLSSAVTNIARKCVALSRPPTADCPLTLFNDMKKDDSILRACDPVAVTVDPEPPAPLIKKDIPSFTMATVTTYSISIDCSYNSGTMHVMDNLWKLFTGNNETSPRIVVHGGTILVTLPPS